MTSRARTTSRWCSGVIRRSGRATVKDRSRIVTDDAYQHETVSHKQGENSIETFWLKVKRAISGTYVSVSKKHPQTYLREFEYRHNLRPSPHVMFDLLLFAFPKASR